MTKSGLAEFVGPRLVGVPGRTVTPAPRKGLGKRCGKGRAATIVWRGTPLDLGNPHGHRRAHIRAYQTRTERMKQTFLSSQFALGDVHANLGADLVVPPATTQSAGYSAGKRRDQDPGLVSLDIFTFTGMAKLTFERLAYARGTLANVSRRQSEWRSR